MLSERYIQIQKRLEALFQPRISFNGEYNYNSELQLLELGLEEADIQEMIGRKVLDLGCGLGNLTEFLRQRGIDAEGIDAEAPSKSYFMRRKIGSKTEGTIPREECYYDLILAHGFTPLGLAFSSAGGGYQDFPIVKQEGEAVLSEALRVLKKGGRMIAVPQLDLLDVNRLTSIRTGNYRIKKRDVWFWQESERDLDERGIDHLTFEPVNYSTEIYKD